MPNDFEAPCAPVERTITVGKKSAIYRFTEPSAVVVEALFDLFDAEGKADPVKLLGQKFRMIAAIVSRADGTRISIEEAGAMSALVVKALNAEALKIIGNEQDAGEAGNV